MTVSIYKTLMQITIHYECLAIYTTVMQITILRAEWKTLGGLLTPMPLSTQQ